MENTKPVGLTLPPENKLSGRQCLKKNTKNTEMMNVPYASTVGSLMYAIVCTRPDIGYVVDVATRYMSNSGKEHWATIKWML
mgnify:CR=1 FL=1